MPRPKPKAYDRLNNFVKEFGETIFLADKSVLFCKICDIKVSAEKRFTVIQHIKTAKHIQGLNRLLNQLKLSYLYPRLSPRKTISMKTYVKRCYQPIYLCTN